MMVKKILKTLALVTIMALFYGMYYIYNALPIGTGYAARYLCASIFTVGREEQKTYVNDIKPVNPLFNLISSSVDLKHKTVTSKALGFLHKKTAIYRRGIGCTLDQGEPHEKLYNQAEGILPLPPVLPDKEWPLGAKVVIPGKGYDSEKLAKAMDIMFPKGDPHKIQTRAVVIVYKGKIIAEKYAPGITPETPLLGWSMTKTITGLIAGVMAKDGKLSKNDPAPVPQWQGKDDPRKKITITHLMNMQDGLDFDENYGPMADATDMLYGSKSFADFTAAKKLRYKPGTTWSYSSGTTNLLMSILRKKSGGTLKDIQNYINTKLFSPLHVHTAFIEPDTSGVPVASSYMYASARDWARLGLFMINDGVAFGKRLLPEGWITFMITPVASSKGKYGAQTWLNYNSKKGLSKHDREYPHLPESLFTMAGHNGQNVFMFPKKKLVVVRLGVTHNKKFLDREGFLLRVLESVK